MQKQMSLWGVGPVFIGLSVVLSLCMALVSYIYRDVFSFDSIFAPIIILSFLTSVFGLFFWIAAGKRIDDSIRKGVLADKGVYGLVRHPIYAGFFYIACGASLLMRSGLMLINIVLIYCLLRIFLLEEEKGLRLLFGEDYICYKAQVNAVFPKPDSFLPAFFYPVDSKKITENLYAIRSKDANLFVITKGDDCICIDAGYHEENRKE
jgi:protein-S-isoprenylcysteine O-methyltransferase Ste14